MKTNTIKVAIIGGGWFGNFHLDNLLTIEGVEVIALCSRTEKSVSTLKQKVPTAHTYTNYFDLFENEKDLQAIIICVPPHQHGTIEKEAAKRNIHLYIEKPISVSLDEVLSFEKAINESTIICSVGYQNLYNPCLDEIKKFLQDKKIGYVHARWIDSMPPPAWWRTKAESGGQLHEQATHLVNVLMYLFGDIHAVFSKPTPIVTQKVANCDVEQASVSTFTFSNGLVANVACGCFVDEKIGKSEIAIDLYTDKGIVSYGWLTDTTFLNANGTKTNSFIGLYHKESMQAFIEAIKTGDRSKIKCDYSFAKRTFIATHSANISMEKGKEVVISPT